MLRKPPEGSPFTWNDNNYDDNNVMNNCMCYVTELFVGSQKPGYIARDLTISCGLKNASLSLKLRTN